MPKDPSFSVDCEEYPYSPNFYNPEVRKKGKPFTGECLNEHCAFTETTDKSLVVCPDCKHVLFWSRK